MNIFTLKKSTLYCLFLLVTYTLHPAKLVYQSDSLQTRKVDHVVNLSRIKRKLLVNHYCREYSTPKEISSLIRYFVHDNPLQYKNKPLPDDLSGRDLSGFDFTQCHFTSTNLTDSNLTGVILVNTTCDYQKAFQENSKKNKLQGGEWYQAKLPKDLKNIAAVYPRLTHNAHKVKILKIASGFSQLPFYEHHEFYIKVSYWFVELVKIKKVLGKPYNRKLTCSLAKALDYDATQYCWATHYPQEKVTINTEHSHDNFVQYWKDFKKGLSQYKCESKDRWGFSWYKSSIKQNIKGLKLTYPHIKEKKLKKEACEIAHALSKSYQVQEIAFQHHYLFYQNKLISLKERVKAGKKNKICYKTLLLSASLLLSWSRGKNKIYYNFKAC